MSSVSPIESTKNWIHGFVINHNLCPFAHGPFRDNRIRFTLFEGTDLEEGLSAFIDEMLLLEELEDVQTSFLILSGKNIPFLDFLDFEASANEIIKDSGFAEKFQIVSFHPSYIFAESEESDPANRTNRSPYPMLHLLRSSDVYEARQNHPDVTTIPNRNIQYLRQLFQHESDK